MKALLSIETCPTERGKALPPWTSRLPVMQPRMQTARLIWTGSMISSSVQAMLRQAGFAVA